MAKTEVILTHNIIGLGGESDQVKVAAGYARNYLYPQGLAIPLTGANKRRLEVLKQRRAEREAHELNSMTELSKSLSKLTCVITAKTGEDGKMFGTVTTGMIADQLKTQLDVTLDKRKIHIEHPIRTLGEHEVELRLHTGVTTNLKLRVESSTPLPAAVAPAPTDEKKDDRRTEKRGRRPEQGAAEAPKAESAEAAARGQKRERSPKPDRRPRPDAAAKPEKSDKAGADGSSEAKA